MLEAPKGYFRISNFPRFSWTPPEYSIPCLRDRKVFWKVGLEGSIYSNPRLYFGTVFLYFLHAKITFNFLSVCRNPRSPNVECSN